MLREPYFLKNPEWFVERRDEEGNVDYELTERAPEEAVKSFKEYQRTMDEQVTIRRDENGDPIIDIENF